ncbi:MATE family efflux transporter [Anaerocolumna sp. AGMB13025]|uniref:MATE family efflux transporter n=1 Tax=Anaerocolumna sp. AGMB13025 TaxID=3039116 RepID=UPI00241CC410|nr:MATE family efflux transporter [Anaerocolumna sp. AGMB13025]WFR56555.1 MATE family efflux transporter [Anaerocolumna sp. AGMB13025]
MKSSDMLHGNTGKSLFLFALPMIIGNLFQQLYTMVDSIIVGRFVNENALAAVGASYALTSVFISVAIGGGIGASVLTSQYLGAKDYSRMRSSIYTALITFLGISILLGIGGFTLSSGIMRWLNTPDNIIDQAALFLRIYFIGLPFLFMYNVLAAVFNSLGKSKIPLYLLIFSSVLNVLMDLFFVIVFHLGVGGVAWATLIAQGISAILAFLILIRYLRNFEKGNYIKRYDIHLLGKIFRIAVPSILQQSIVSIGMMLVQSVVNGFGSEVLAGYSSAMRIEGICVVPLSAMGNAVSTFTAQNIGAGQKERVKKGYFSAYIILAAFAVLICGALELFHTPIISAFLNKESSNLALQTGTAYLKFMGFFYIMLGLKMITDGLLRGAGDMKVFTAANLVNLAIRVFVAFQFAPVWGIAAVWYAVPMGWTANYLLSFSRYLTGKWKEIDIR